MFVTGQDIAQFLGRGSDAALVALADSHAATMAHFVNGYVRGHGPVLVNGVLDFPADLAHVVITAAARLVTNPAQVAAEASDGYSARGGFTSFSLAEQAVLHRYRRRAA